MAERGKLMRKLMLAATLTLGVALSMTAATASNAAQSFDLGGTACALGNISPTATGCRGWFEGKMNSGNGDAKAASAAALNDLLGVNTFTGPTLSWLQDLSGNVFGGNGTVDFTTALYGQTVVSFHVGGARGQANGVGYQGSAFYVFNAGNAVGGLNTFTFNLAGLSNARLYSTGSYVDPCANPNSPGCGGGNGGGNGVPEPATWALMIMGFGSAGAMLRRRRTLAA